MKRKRTLLELKEKYKPELKQCEICNSINFYPFQHFSRIGKNLVYGENQTLICSRCSYKMQNPRYPNEFYREYYSEAYRDICFGSLAPNQAYIDDQKRRGKRVMDYCRQFFEKPATVLDHGSASGGALIPFKANGWETYGVDPHEISILTGKKELGIDLRLGVGEDLPFEDNSIDLLISLGSLEHSYDIELSLKEIRRVIKPNSGILFIRWRSDELWGSPLEFFNHNHYRFFTDETLNLLLLKNGFEVIKNDKYEIERKPGEVYTIAKVKQVDIEGEFNSLLNEYEKNNISLEQIKNHAIYKLNYLKRCSEFISMWNNSNKDYLEFAKEIRSKKDSKHRILLGEEKWAVDRAIKEAEIYISEWEKGNVF